MLWAREGNCCCLDDDDGEFNEPKFKGEPRKEGAQVKMRFRKVRSITTTPNPKMAISNLKRDIQESPAF